MAVANGEGELGSRPPFAFLLCLSTVATPLAKPHGEEHDTAAMTAQSPLPKATGVLRDANAASPSSTAGATHSSSRQDGCLASVPVTCCYFFHLNFISLSAFLVALQQPRPVQVEAEAVASAADRRRAEHQPRGQPGSQAQ